MLPGVSKRLLLVALGAGGLVVISIVFVLTLATRGNGSGTAPARTGSNFLTTSQSSDIAILDLATGRIRLATDRDGRYLAVSSPTWSSDGRRLAFAQQACPHCPFRIAVAGSTGTGARLIRGQRNDLNEPSWSADGDRLAVTKSEHLERALAILDLSGRLHPLEVEEEEEVGKAGEVEEVESPNHPAFSPDGHTLAFDAETDRERTSLFLLDVGMKEVRAVKSPADHYGYPAFSPNGRLLAFSRTDATFTWDLCVAPLSGRNQRCLTHGPANDTEPSWAPDGRSIIFASDREDPKAGLRSLYVVSADGSGLRRLTTGFDDGAPAFSPDGTEVAFVRRGIVEAES